MQLWATSIIETSHSDRHAKRKTPLILRGPRALRDNRVAGTPQTPWPSTRVTTVQNLVCPRGARIASGFLRTRG